MEISEAILSVVKHNRILPILAKIDDVCNAHNIPMDMRCTFAAIIVNSDMVNHFPDIREDARDGEDIVQCWDSLERNELELCIRISDGGRFVQVITDPASYMNYEIRSERFIVA